MYLTTNLIVKASLCISNTYDPEFAASFLRMRAVALVHVVTRASDVFSIRYNT